MTVRQYIINGLIEAGKERITSLEKLGAPSVMVDGQRKYVEKLQKGILEVGGDKDALDDKFVNAEKKKGKGGKSYYVINGNINFFPAAKYGMYIKRA